MSFTSRGEALRAFVWASFTSPNCRRTMKDTFKREIKYMRISLTELCNLRCRYCMPEEGVCKKSHDEMMTQEEIVTAVRVASKLGVTKIRLTGGEPLVKKDIVQLVSRIKEINGIEVYNKGRRIKGYTCWNRCSAQCRFQKN